MNTGRGIVLGVATVLFATPVSGHHSGAMFDAEESITLTGTVTSFQWTNPHCWIQVRVATETTSAEWSVEMGPPSDLFRGGWRPGTLQAGDKITVVVHPARDGSMAGLYISAADANGKVIGKRP